MKYDKDLKYFVKEAASTQELTDMLTVGLSDKEREALIAESDPLIRVTEALRTVQDPEMSVNIVDLGLVYDIVISDHAIDISMTLTAPTCPVAEAIPTEARRRIEDVFPEGTIVSVSLVWQPPWTRDKMSDEAKLLLDMW